MRPFYCRVGSKWNIRKRILEHVPKHRTYVEPFVGSGAIFFAKEPSEVEVLNDKDTELVRDYELLRTIKINQDDFPSPDTFETEDKMNAYYKDAPDNPTHRLIKAVLIRCFTYNSCGKGKLYLNGKSRSPLTRIKNTADYQERLKSVKILNTSYETIIQQYDAQDTFFYLDPPYENSKRLYEDGVMDYKKMRELLDTVKGKWLMSLNDSPAIRETFKGHCIKDLRLTARGGVSIGSKGRNEILIANYPI